MTVRIGVLQTARRASTRPDQGPEQWAFASSKTGFL
jgi:hypothetical protein